ncbi:hypothetical protein [Micromonospora sp. NPDC047134]|uniref:hypothetical protein n=1 Tax=Micromonospora sp. NPDC047134 TaxID=3154340 RepID=UPI003405B985
MQRWERELRAAGVHPCRSKIEAAPWCVGVPQSDEQATAEPSGRYFEHHVKLLLPSTAVADLAAGERLPLPPEMLTLPGVDEPMLAAPASLDQLHRRVPRYPGHRRAVDQATGPGPRTGLDLTTPEQVDEIGTRSIRLS